MQRGHRQRHADFRDATRRQRQPEPEALAQPQCLVDGGNGGSRHIDVGRYAGLLSRHQQQHHVGANAGRHAELALHQRRRCARLPGTDDRSRRDGAEHRIVLHRSGRECRQNAARYGCHDCLSYRRACLALRHGGQQLRPLPAAGFGRYRHSIGADRHYVGGQHRHVRAGSRPPAGDDHW